MKVNFVKPHLNGIARKMTRSGIKAMTDPESGNLVVNHRGKVFEMEREQTAIPEVLAYAHFINCDDDLRTLTIDLMPDGADPYGVWVDPVQVTLGITSPFHAWDTMGSLLFPDDTPCSLGGYGAWLITYTKEGDLISTVHVLTAG